MKSNLAVLSSDNKTIQFIKNNNLQDLCNLYANSSRNTDDAKLFSENHGFEKYYGSYEDLIEDDNIEYIVNFLPTGIKFEYTYLALKKNKKIAHIKFETTSRSSASSSSLHKATRTHNPHLAYFPEKHASKTTRDAR